METGGGTVPGNIAETIQKLEVAGYRFTAEGENIRARRAFRGSASEEEIRRLLGQLKARKSEALAYLRARDGPHPADCVCLDCMREPFFRSESEPGSSEPAGEAEGSPAVREVTVMGRRVRAYPARRECMEYVDPQTGKRGACLWLSQADCGLYAFAGPDGLTGWCRERVNAAVWKTLPEA